MTYFPAKFTFAWLKKCYESGEVTPIMVAEEIIRRAKQYKDYNIWIVEPNMSLLEKYIAALPAVPDSNHPLWGIPFAIKDNIDLEKVPTTAACKAYEYIPEKSATVVAKLIALGAIPVGKSNLDQFATGLVGTRSPYGEVHNALQPELISGGSSSGSAVAVALGMAAFSLGTDTAGSGRVPAALNGLVGYKPALGAWSVKGVIPACASLDSVTVFANNLEDVQKVNLLARGFDEDDCWSRKYALPIEKFPQKICLPKDSVKFYGSFAEIYKQKWYRALDRIKNIGIEIEYIDYTIFQKAAAILYDGPWVAERWEGLGGFVEENREKVLPVTEKILLSGKNSEYTAAKLFKAMHEIQEYRALAKKILKDAVLVMPTAGGTFTRKQVRENPIETNSQMGLYTNHCNLLDLCAIAVPTESRCNQIPFGVTIFGLADSESLILGMARIFLKKEAMKIAVCGLHKKGYPLESQLVELGAVYLESTRTAACYKLYELDTIPVKPGMVKSTEGGECIAVDIYEMPIENFGQLMLQISAPLCLGMVELSNGENVTGFLCEGYQVIKAKDITAHKSFTL
ncbi:MAG: allophanate hydrolase [Anaerocolumna sp.]